MVVTLGWLSKHAFSLGAWKGFQTPSAAEREAEGEGLLVFHSQQHIFRVLHRFTLSVHQTVGLSVGGRHWVRDNNRWVFI